jgi:hypothetical protein
MLCQGQRKRAANGGAAAYAIFAVDCGIVIERLRIQAYGNEFGGGVMQGQSHPHKAFREAQEHCLQYGKSAELTRREVYEKSDDQVV